MAFLNDFDAEQYEPNQNYDLLPVGTYEAMITNSDVKDTKAGTGKRLALTWQITTGDYEGRLVFDNINIENINAQAQEIGRKQLSAICHAVGKLRISDSTELHDIPCLITLKIRQGNGEYGPRNEVTKYIAIGSGASGGGSGPAKPEGKPDPKPVPNPAPRQTATAGANGSRPPWARK